MLPYRIMTTHLPSNNIRSGHMRSKTHQPIRSNPVCVGLASGAQLSIVDRLIEFRTKDNQRITCMIQFKTSSTNSLIKYPPTQLQAQFVHECRSFFRSKAFSELEEIRENDLLPKLICSPPTTVRVVSTVIIPFILNPEDDSSNLMRIAETLEPSDLYHDATVYCSDGYELCIRLHINHRCSESTRGDLVDDITNKHVVFFWTRTKKQVVSDYNRGDIPQFLIDSEFGSAVISYKLVVVDPVPWSKQLDLHGGGSW